jgi:molybdopterin-binding protein
MREYRDGRWRQVVDTPAIQVIPHGRPLQLKEKLPMELSARNQLKGRVTRVKSGTVMAKVEVAVEGGTVVAAITDGSRQRLNVAEGDEVTVIIKATEVMIGK